MAWNQQLMHGMFYWGYSSTKNKKLNSRSKFAPGPIFLVGQISLTRSNWSKCGWTIKMCIDYHPCMHGVKKNHPLHILVINLNINIDIQWWSIMQYKHTTHVKVGTIVECQWGHLSLSLSGVENLLLGQGVRLMSRLNGHSETVGTNGA